MAYSKKSDTLLPNTLIYEMSSLMHILGLSLWLFLASQSSKTAVSQNPAEVVQGSVYIDGGLSIGMIDEDFICATMDWWPPTKCDYGTCSWGNASLLNLVLLQLLQLN